MRRTPTNNQNKNFCENVFLFLAIVCLHGKCANERKWKKAAELCAFISRVPVIKLGRALSHSTVWSTISIFFFRNSLRINDNKKASERERERIEMCYQEITIVLIAQFSRFLCAFSSYLLFALAKYDGQYGPHTIERTRDRETQPIEIGKCWIQMAKNKSDCEYP